MQRCEQQNKPAAVCRWVNCLLIREIPFQLAIRLWDTYLAEGTRMRDFLTYVLAAFLLTWSSQLKRMEFQVQVVSISSVVSHRRALACMAVCAILPC